MSYIKDPKGIEVRSFEIITEGLGNRVYNFAENEKPIVKDLYIQREILDMRILQNFTMMQ